jgi:hypothetical protein
MRPISKIPSTKKGLIDWPKCEALSSNPRPTKKINKIKILVT